MKIILEFKHKDINDIRVDYIEDTINTLLLEKAKRTLSTKEDLIEKEVSEDNTVVNKSDLYIIKNNITEINKRQIEGYSTFKKVEENLITLDKNIFKVWSLLFVVFILSVINLLIN